MGPDLSIYQRTPPSALDYAQQYANLQSAQDARVMRQMQIAQLVKAQQDEQNDRSLFSEISQRDPNTITLRDIAQFSPQGQARLIQSLAGVQQNVKNSRINALVDSFMPKDGTIVGQPQNVGTPPVDASTPEGQAYLARRTGGQQGNFSSRVAALTPDQIAAMQMAGVPGSDKLVELWKMSREGFKLPEGWYSDAAGNVGYRPTVKVSDSGQASITQMGPNGQLTVSAPQGALGTYAQYQAINKLVNAGTNIREITDANGQKRLVTDLNVLNNVNGLGDLSSVLGGMSQPAPQPAPMTGRPRPLGATPDMRVPPNVQASRDADALAVLQDERDRAKNPQDRAAIEQEIAMLQKRMRSQGAAAPGMPAGPTQEQQRTQEAIAAYNKNFIDKDFPAIRQSASDASSLINTIDMASRSLKGIGKSGWGTETQANLANVLAGLGIAPESAKQLAANAQTFKAAAGTRLWEVLNQAKGPQTEGDAQRAADTFAKLSNVADANQFILDVMRANAELTQVKNRFYQSAYAAQQKAGNVNAAEIDGAWNEKPPSLWDRPIMQRWAK